jgi:cell division protein FtsN
MEEEERNMSSEEKNENEGKGFSKQTILNMSLFIVVCFLVICYVKVNSDMNRAEQYSKVNSTKVPEYTFAPMEPESEEFDEYEDDTEQVVENEDVPMAKPVVKDEKKTENKPTTTESKSTTKNNSNTVELNEGSVPNANASTNSNSTQTKKQTNTNVSKPTVTSKPVKQTTAAPKATSKPKKQPTKKPTVTSAPVTNNEPAEGSDTVVSSDEDE